MDVPSPYTAERALAVLRGAPINAYELSRCLVAGGIDEDGNTISCPFLAARAGSCFCDINGFAPLISIGVYANRNIWFGCIGIGLGKRGLEINERDRF